MTWPEVAYAALVLGFVLAVVWILRGRPVSEDRSTAPWDAWRHAEAEVLALLAQVEELRRERDEAREDRDAWLSSANRQMERAKRSEAEVERLRAALNWIALEYADQGAGIRASAPEAAEPSKPERDFDCACPEPCLGHCWTCGLLYEDGVTHGCPPGFTQPSKREGFRKIPRDYGEGNA